MKTKLKRPTFETIQWAYAIIDWLYYAPRSRYSEIKYSKKDLLNVLEGLREDKIALTSQEKKNIEERDKQ